MFNVKNKFRRIDDVDWVSFWIHVAVIGGIAGCCAVIWNVA